MRLIVGLGNPGRKYENTRHNVGFLIISNLKSHNSKLNLKSPLRGGRQISNPQLKTKNFKSDKKSNAEMLVGELNNEKIILVKPQTYMNNSGEAVKKIMGYYKISSDDLWVVCDDLDLELGTIRIRLEGSSGGHKGLQSIIDQIGDKFARIRVGIGSNKCQNISAEDYVLQKFPKEDTKILEQVIDRCAKLILESLDRGVKEETMNII